MPSCCGDTSSACSTTEQKSPGPCTGCPCRRRQAAPACSRQASGAAPVALIGVSACRVGGTGPTKVPAGAVLNTRHREEKVSCGCSHVPRSGWQIPETDQWETTSLHMSHPDWSIPLLLPSPAAASERPRRRGRRGEWGSLCGRSRTLRTPGISRTARLQGVCGAGIGRGGEKRSTCVDNTRAPIHFIFRLIKDL